MGLSTLSITGKMEFEWLVTTMSAAKVITDIIEGSKLHIFSKAQKN